MPQRIIIAGPHGGTVNRLEIYDFIKDDKFFSLYIQALQVMQKERQTHPLSFFQIGGIHGLPYKPWNGIKGAEDRTWGGYCTHGSVLFPTWHRPYVLLYEQVLQDHARKIAATYTTDRDAWREAAENLRQPYWDWAATAVPPDQVIALKKVTITKAPSGKTKEVDNPLYNYTFHPIDASFPEPYQEWKTTLRQPKYDPDDIEDATDDPQRVKDVLNAAFDGTRTNTYNMLTRVHTWPAFSNHTAGEGGGLANSLEVIHDNIHGQVGGEGQMGDPAVAGFDPIFYLHHANVDRMLSLWSALNPTVWVTPGSSVSGTYTISAGKRVGANTALTPFSDEETTFWTSAGTTSTAGLGYSYPEFDGLDTGNTDTIQIAIGKTVNKLYGDDVSGKKSTNTRASSKLPSQNTVRHGSGLSRPPQTTITIEADTTPPDHGPHDWTARIEFNQFELPSSFSVAIFLAGVPDDPDEWEVSPNHVGSYYAFVNSAATACENCRNNTNAVVEGFVHLNQAIVRHSGLKSLEPGDVVPYLTHNLEWRVLKANREPVEFDLLRSLKVTVHSTPLNYHPGAIFIDPGEPRRWDDITKGRVGGLPIPPE